jgi:hypothetical protein
LVACLAVRSGGPARQQRIRRVREDLRPVGLDREIEAKGHKSYRLAIEAQHISFDRDVIAQVAELAAIAKQIR